MKEAVKDIVSIASQKISDVTGKRCEKCPAYWENVDYWGEYDAGCTLHRDHLEFCSLSLLPKAVMKPYVKYKERQEEKYWEEMYEKDREKWEMEDLAKD